MLKGRIMTLHYMLTFLSRRLNWCRIHDWSQRLFFDRMRKKKMRFHAVVLEATSREFVGWTTLWRRSFAIKLAGSSHLPQAPQPIGSAAEELTLQIAGTVNKPSFVMVHYAVRKPCVRMAIAAPTMSTVASQVTRLGTD